MKAMILAAGLGTRLRPLTNTQPKALLPVANRPLIHYTLLLLRRFGITDVVINLHHHGEKIVEALGDGSSLGMQIRYSPEPKILGTGGGIKQAHELLTGGTFLVINSDILIDLNIDKLVECHHRRRAAVSMVVRADHEATHYGAIEVDTHERIRRILGRGGPAPRTLRQFMFTGVHILEPRVFDFVPDTGFSSITDIYIKMLTHGEKLFAYVTKGAWMDLGAPERYNEANRQLESGQLKLGYLRQWQPLGLPSVDPLTIAARRGRTRPSHQPIEKTRLEASSAEKYRRHAVKRPAGKASRPSATEKQHRPSRARARRSGL